MTNLEKLQARIVLLKGSATGETAKEVYGILGEVIAEIIQIPPAVGQPDSDALIACQQARAKLQEIINRKDGVINDQADILHRIGAALQADDLTAASLVSRAGEIMTELTNRRKGKL